MAVGPQKQRAVALLFGGVFYPQRWRRSNGRFSSKQLNVLSIYYTNQASKKHRKPNGELKLVLEITHFQICLLLGENVLCLQRKAIRAQEQIKPKPRERRIGSLRTKRSWKKGWAALDTSHDWSSSSFSETLEAMSLVRVVSHLSEAKLFWKASFWSPFHFMPGLPRTLRREVTHKLSVHHWEVVDTISTLSLLLQIQCYYDSGDSCVCDWGTLHSPHKSNDLFTLARKLQNANTTQLKAVSSTVFLRTLIQNTMQWIWLALASSLTLFFYSPLFNFIHVFETEQSCPWTCYSPASASKPLRLFTL